MSNLNFDPTQINALEEACQRLEPHFIGMASVMAELVECSVPDFLRSMADMIEARDDDAVHELLLARVNDEQLRALVKRIDDETK